MALKLSMIFHFYVLHISYVISGKKVLHNLKSNICEISPNLKKFLFLKRTATEHNLTSMLTNMLVCVIPLIMEFARVKTSCCLPVSPEKPPFQGTPW